MAAGAVGVPWAARGVRPAAQPSRWGWFGYFEVEWEALRRWQAVAVNAGGPVISVLVPAALLIGAAMVPRPAAVLIWAAALAVAWRVVVTTIPMRYPGWFGPYAGWASDGYRIVRLLRSC